MPSGVPAITVIAVGAPSKSWWRSRTLWFNALCLMLAAAELQLGVIRDKLPGGLYAWLAFALPLGNAALRAITTAQLVASSSAPK